MNRREFVKALAGIPLLGLLASVLKVKAPYHEIDVLTFNGASHRVEDYIDASASNPWHTMVYEGSRLISDDDPGDRYWGPQESTEPILRY